MSNTTFSISGHIVHITEQTTIKGTVYVNNGRIERIEPAAPNQEVPQQYIMPGFIDAHVHIESSMLVPAQFARLAVVHGTVATISDPHEIGNVLGIEGVQYMINNGRQTPFKFHFGAPSCVPATPFETAGAEIDVEGVRQLLQMPEVSYLSEMMNWPGVLNKDPQVMQKLAIAHELGKPVDGHAPGLKGQQAQQYAAAGITTDHECFTAEEATDKLACGMKVIIREGSAAKNFDALAPLLHQHAHNMMFCSDDKHPDNLALGHINELAARAVQLGVNVYQVLLAACVNPVHHYNMQVGLLQPGQPADFIVVNDLEHFQVKQTYINGQLVANEGETLIPSTASTTPNRFNIPTTQPTDYRIPQTGTKVQAIVAEDGQLITKAQTFELATGQPYVNSDTTRDLLKLAVINRYQQAPPALALVHRFGLQQGAIASSVAHDSHNIIAVGVTDQAICQAVNLVVNARGGVAAVSDTEQQLVALPVAGLMSAQDGYAVAEAYAKIDAMAKAMGSTLQSPFMTLSFMALLVIPELKLSDKGLFNGLQFQFTNLFVGQ